MNTRLKVRRKPPPQLPQARVWAMTHAVPPSYTGLEDRGYAALDALGIPYIKQAAFKPFVVDAWIPELHLAIEFDGDIYHGCPVHEPEDAEWHARRRARRDGYLAKDYGLRTIHIFGCEMQDQRAAFLALSAALKPYLPWEATR